MSFWTPSQPAIRDVLAGYCVRFGDDPQPEDLEGLGHQPVRHLTAAGLGIWISEAVPTPADPDALKTHDAVVREALRTATPLPLRFGTLFDDEAAAREALITRADEFRAALERVSGCVEMGIRVMWEMPPEIDQDESEISSGTDYLLARRKALLGHEARIREAEAMLDEIEACFESMELETVRTILPAPDVAGTLAQLVRRSELHRYKQCADAARESSGAAPRFSGPWAPYSFV